ncbi:hypothetical protein N802_09865 [Knoellia sinensis KCTC 19936]|uniref:DUF4386 family protein n=1 Tax=Knoellia sinensis KCTC 19936 TaxID=1385520 RepID=A0A0A0J384_9MICO|nr:hypothetical protein [Knoellia sinensis]KGN30091.1 hypothetical protein N802_09865 [Knoellia sinensis KCTC 19936]
MSVEGSSNGARPGRIAGGLRGTVAVSLVLGALLIATSVMLMPDYADGRGDFLANIAEAKGAATISASSFILAQLFLGIGLVGVAHVIRDRAPRLVAAGAMLAGLAAFGHSVYGGARIVMLSMADDLTAVDTHVATLDRAESGIAIPFMAAGLLGTVLGTVMLGIAVWRAGFGPRWLGPAMVAWVVVEFVGSSLSVWAGYASGLMYLGVLGTLAVEVWRSPITRWQTAAEAEGEVEGETESAAESETPAPIPATSA